MGTYDFVIKAGDLLPVITATLEDAAGAPVDLTTAVGVKFILRQVSSETPKVNAAAAIVDAAAGRVSYTWTGTDTNTPDVYFGEWQVTWSGTKPQTFPNAEHLVIRITDQLGS